MSNPGAAYDALFIVEGFSSEFDFVLEGEVHTLAYLALLLSISAGREAEAWGYRFVSTASAAPFSESLHEAISTLAGRGVVGVRGPRLTASRSAAAVLEGWRTLPGNRSRAEYLRASIAAASALSLPTAVRSVHREPQLRRAEQLGVLRALPEEHGIDEVLSQLEEVDSALGEVGLSKGEGRDARLVARARLWLSYLASEDPERAVEEGLRSAA